MILHDIVAEKKIELAESKNKVPLEEIIGLAEHMSHPADFAAALAVPGVRLHLYEKHTPRAGRKMGHLSATAATADEALERVLEAKRRL